VPVAHPAAIALAEGVGSVIGIGRRGVSEDLLNLDSCGVSCAVKESLDKVLAADRGVEGMVKAGGGRGGCVHCGVAQSRDWGAEAAKAVLRLSGCAPGGGASGGERGASCGVVRKRRMYDRLGPVDPQVAVSLENLGETFNAANRHGRGSSDVDVVHEGSDHKRLSAAA
jgi:hypothetical protein